MKVMLVEPPMSPFDVPQGLMGLPEPLPLEMIAAELIKHHDVEIVDLRVEKELDGRLEQFQPDIVAVGAVTSNLHSAEAVLQRAKEKNPEVLTLLGGHHVSFMPEDGLRDFVDVVVVGEADYTVAEVVGAHEARRPLVEVPGIVLREGNWVCHTPGRDLCDMNDLERPARHLVAHLRAHYFQRGYRPIVSINGSRGCPNRCKFCTLWKLNHGQYRTRLAELLVEEMAEFDEEFVDFIDDNSLEDTRRIARFADLLIENGIRKRLKLYGRADTVARNEALVERLAEAGLELLLVGFEACTELALEDLNKSSSVSCNTRAIQILQKYGIRIAAYFVVDPRFTKKDFDALWNYVDRMELMDPIFTILVPFPGSELYSSRRDQIICHDYRLYDFFHTVMETTLPLGEFYDQFALLYEKAYDRERQLGHNQADLPQTELEAYTNVFGVIMDRIRNLPRHHQIATAGEIRAVR
jgi:radical SAM superfamily enzyme YgiQ (UPF0313 family)